MQSYNLEFEGNFFSKFVCVLTLNVCIKTMQISKYKNYFLKLIVL